ncbi:hypothetical protein DFP72DRAFT_1070094 [Ephemerocybe angulata]|uniref:Uncharacterized protein n=1 Tax=Ephemerocybe angulata TaxID=980116 RepID=A0A8H6M5H0_9AGAR|nr:hypothetical protein DFP72DRAFT_1070094 [Tulosesus angulatus]
MLTTAVGGVGGARAFTELLYGRFETAELLYRVRDSRAALSGSRQQSCSIEGSRQQSCSIVGSWWWSVFNETAELLYRRVVARLVVVVEVGGVRALAARCLALIYRTERRVDVPDGELSAQDTLTELLATEPSSEVRKQIISNLKLNKTTVPHIVKRTRDEDVLVRKLVYGVLKEGSTTFRDDEEIIGHCHPERLCPSDLDAMPTSEKAWETIFGPPIM